MRHHLEQISARKSMARALEIDLCKNNKSVRSAPASHPWQQWQTHTGKHRILTHTHTRRSAGYVVYIYIYGDIKVCANDVVVIK